MRRFLLWLLSIALKTIPADKALRLLLRLDQRLYFVQGQFASRYGGGIHTKHRHMNYHRFFVDNIDAEDKVIDIGCGIGAVAHTVAEQADVYVTGIDLNEKSITKAKERHAHPKITFQVGDALTDLPDQTFDSVILSNVLEHLTGRPSFLQQVSQKLQPRQILIRVPVFERDWRVPLKKELGVEWRLDPTHEIEYTIETFADEMKEAKLAITHQEIRWGEIWAVTKPLPN